MPIIKFVSQSKMFGDSANDHFVIVFNIHVAKSKNIPALFPDKRLPFKIGIRCLIVIAAVNFNDEFCADAGEIRKVWPDGMLATKLQAANLLGARSTPQKTF